MKKSKKVYIVGIKGAGTSALAKIYSDMGYSITGSDVPDTFITQTLLDKCKKIKIFDSFSKTNVGHPNFAVRSVAYREDNPEVAYIVKNKIPLFTYPEAINKLITDEKLKVIAVAGCKGKTTTTAIISQILEYAKLDPSYLIGATFQDKKPNAKKGESNLFVVEADEYRNAFLNYSPFAKAIIITNILFDHPDFFSSLEDTWRAFKQFVETSPKNCKIYVCDDFQEDFNFIKTTNRKIITYGLKDHNLWHTRNVHISPKGSFFEVYYKKIYKGRFSIPLYGEHNVQNCLAAIAFCLDLGINEKIIAKAIKKIDSAKRRLEVIYHDKKTTIIDDYAHHPIAIKVTIEAVRQKYPNINIICVFQPHTYSRTKALYNEFAQSLSLGDEIFLTNIYCSAREKYEDFRFDSEIIANELYKYGKKAVILPVEKMVNVFTKKNLKNSVILSMGAGDSWSKFAIPLANHLRSLTQSLN